MLQSASDILSHYLDIPVSRYAFRHYEMTRIDVEEFLYLCQVKDAWYVVYETDFVDNLPGIVAEVIDVYEGDFRPIHWLPKKSAPDAAPLAPTAGKAFEAIPKTHIYAVPATPLRCMVLAVEPTHDDISKAPFGAYGGA